MATTSKSPWFKISEASSHPYPQHVAQKSLWNKDAKLQPKCSEFLPSTTVTGTSVFAVTVEPTYFTKRTKTLKRLVKRFYYLSSSTLYYAEKRKSQSIKGQLNLNTVYAEFYESKVAILKNAAKTYIISLRQDSGQFVELLTDSVLTFKQWTTEIRRHSYMTDFGTQFSIVKMIGKGGFARVFLAEDQESKDQYAVKVISKDSLLLQPKGIKSLQTEIQVMRELKGVTGCLQLYGVYITDSSVNLILEYIKGGELVKRLRLKQNSSYTMESVWSLIREILGALAEIHARHIIHRDLKPENILLINDTKHSSIKIADYGLSTFDCTKVQNFIFKRCGTPGFIAPEVLSTKDDHKMYNQKVDVFSAGVIFFILLCGEQPFVGSTHRQVLELNKKCNVNFLPIDSNPKIPQKAKSLVRMMMEKDPTLRPSAVDCLNTIFQSDNDIDHSLSIEFIKYESNRLASIDGLNRIILSSSKGAEKSDEDVYWMNPFWKGQTKTIQTESKLSSTYIQINDVRKRNKSNFAPNSPQLVFDESGQLQTNANNNPTNQQQIREIRSASADSDLKIKFQPNHSMHIAVLMKNKLGDEQQRSPNTKKQIHFFRDKASTATTQERMTTNYTSNERTTTIAGMPSLHRWEFQTEPKQSSVIMEESNLEKYNTLDEVKDTSNNDEGLAAIVKQTSSSVHRSHSKQSDEDPDSAARSKSKSLPNQNYKSSSAVNTVASDEQQQPLSKQECNLNANEADENHCQAIQQMSITLKDYLRHNIKKQPPTSHSPSTPPASVFSKQQERARQIVAQKGEEPDSEISMNQPSSSPMNSCLEADFRVSEVEEHHISLNHVYNQINRNIFFKFSPFNRDPPYLL